MTDRPKGIVVDIKEFYPLFTLILGWILSEGSNALRRRGNRKEAIRLALAELLELRHKVIGNQFLFGELAKQIQLPPTAVFQLRKALPSPMQNDPSVSGRFNSALTEVAKHAPFLAYQLRGKDILNMIETLFHPEAIQDDRFAAFAHETQQNLYEELLPTLDLVVVRTAKHVGIATWLRALYLIKYKPRISKDVRTMTDRFMNSLAEQLKTQAGEVK